LETTRLKQMKKYLFMNYQLDAVRAVETATLSLITGVKAATLSRAMGELMHVGRGVYKEVNGWKYIIAEITSLMTGVKAACLSLSLRAMKELTDVGRGVYTIVEYKQEKVSLPTIKSIVVVYSVAVKSKSVKKSVVVEAMLGMPLSLTRNSVMKDSSLYSDGEEVLAELGVKLDVFPPSKMQKSYEVAEWKHVEKKHITRAGMKDRKVKLGEKMGVLKDADSRIFQPLSWGCIGC